MEKLFITLVIKSDLKVFVSVEIERGGAVTVSCFNIFFPNVLHVGFDEGIESVDYGTKGGSLSTALKGELGR